MKKKKGTKGGDGLSSRGGGERVGRNREKKKKKKTNPYEVSIPVVVGTTLTLVGVCERKQLWEEFKGNVKNPRGHRSKKTK